MGLICVIIAVVLCLLEGVGGNVFKAFHEGWIGVMFFALSTIVPDSVSLRRRNPD